MSSRSHLSYSARARTQLHPLAQKLFLIAEEKKTNLVLSADVTTSKALLDIAEAVGPHIAVLKTHIDVLSDLTPDTLAQLIELKHRHNFLVFEDRKFVDIGHTVQLQYHGGALKISEWADIVNIGVVPGPGIAKAFSEVMKSDDFVQNFGKGTRAVLILAEMTSAGNLATGNYTKLSVELARQYPDVFMGFVALRRLNDISCSVPEAENEDFVVFTTGVNLASKGDTLGQTYQTPESVFKSGSDFIICGRGIYKADDPVKAAAEYRTIGWEAYQQRIGSM